MKSSWLLRLALAGVLVAFGCSKSSNGPVTPPPPEDPICSLDAAALSFGSVTVGSSADRQVRLSNTGGGRLSGAISESCAEFSLVGATGYDLGAGQSATFTVRFTPTSPGPKTCTLATGSTGCATVTCSGTGVAGAPLCEVTPSALSFGQVAYGISQILPVTVRNAGGGTLTGSLSGLTGDFTLLDPPAFSLGAGEASTFSVRFQPSFGGAQACSLRFGTGECAPIACTGLGLLPTAFGCQVYVLSDTLDFGQVGLGTSAERNFVLKNPSSSFLAEAVVTEICPEFALSGPTSPDIDPGGTFTGTVRFTPTREGVQYCAMLVSCFMNGSGTNGSTSDYVLCKGLGVGGSPLCALSTTTLDFGSVVVGESKDLPLTVRNTGTGVLSGIAGPSHCSEFAFVGPTAYSLGPGEATTLTLRFAPTQAGHTLTCSNLPIGLECSAVTAVGGGVAPPACALSTTLLDFGTVPVGQTKDLTFDLSNSGGGTLCGSVTEGCAPFAVIQNDQYCTTPPAFVRVTVRFSPTTAGLHDCVVSIGPGCTNITASGVGN